MTKLLHPDCQQWAAEGMNIGAGDARVTVQRFAMLASAEEFSKLVTYARAVELEDIGGDPALITQASVTEAARIFFAWQAE